MQTAEALPVIFPSVVLTRTDRNAECPKRAVSRHLEARNTQRTRRRHGRMERLPLPAPQLDRTLHGCPPVLAWLQMRWYLIGTYLLRVSCVSHSGNTK